MFRCFVFYDTKKKDEAVSKAKRQPLQRSEVDSYIRISTQQKEDYWLFSVEDNGIGIKEDFFEKIFLYFVNFIPTKNTKARGSAWHFARKLLSNTEGKYGWNQLMGKGLFFIST